MAEIVWTFAVEGWCGTRKWAIEAEASSDEQKGLTTD